MTAKTYNRLLAAHATRRRNLISAVNRVVGPPFEDSDCGPWFYTGLCQDITLAVLENPIIDRERLYLCTEDGREFKCWHGTGCKVPHEGSTVTSPLSSTRWGKSGRYQNTEAGGCIPSGVGLVGSPGPVCGFTPVRTRTSNDNCSTLYVSRVSSTIYVSGGTVKFNLCSYLHNFSQFW